MSELLNQTDQETKRLAKLKSYEILDTHPEIEFDIIANLISEIFDTPIALITFIDDERIFIKSQVGFSSAKEILLSGSLFENAIHHTNVQVFNPNENLIKSAQKNHYLNQRKIGFYASAPLLTSNGLVMGNICAVDFNPNEATEKQLNMLKSLAQLVMEKLDSRVFIRKTIRTNDERMHMLIHDLKNPMTTLSLHAELIGKIAHDQEKVLNMSVKMGNQAKNVVSNLNDILTSSRSENGTVKIQKTKIDLLDVLRQAESAYQNLLIEKSQKLFINLNQSLELFGDASRLILAFEQVIDNAIKFSNPGNEIHIDFKAEENKIIISIKDSGQGILAEELDQLFIKFVSLTAVPAPNKRANGLGLALTKMLIDLHKGKIWAESGGRNMGSTFYVELPIK